MNICDMVIKIVTIVIRTSGHCEVTSRKGEDLQTRGSHILFQFCKTNPSSLQQTLGNMEGFPPKGDQALGKGEQIVIPVKGLFPSKSSMFLMSRAVVCMKCLEMHWVLHITPPQIRISLNNPLNFGDMKIEH